MAHLTYLQLAQRVIEEQGKPLSVDEIWQLGLVKGYDKELASKGKTPWATLGAQLYVDVRDNAQSIFSTTSSRPKRFGLRRLSTVDDSAILPLETPTPVTVKKPTYRESDLHPFVVYYGFHYLKAHLKTIHHSKSNKKEYGEWVHPDIVGCYFPFGDWEDEVVEVSSRLGNSAVKLFSFELKRELSFSNLREAFFQAVSNSSWANEGYLAAAEVSQDEDFKNELKRLCGSFGIGVIRIDLEDPDATDVLFPAKARDLVDWETINKLMFNPDFGDFVKRIRLDIQTKEVRQERYDPILTKEELLKSICK